MKKKSLLLLIGLLLVVFGSSWSLLKPGLFYIHDYVHAARISEMQRMLADGQVPPRWSQNFGFGYGMPLFQFYAPFPYFLGATLYSLALPMEAVIKLLFLLTSVVTAVGGFSLGKRLWGDFGGLFAAAALTLAPYRALNLFVRGALSEAMGMMVFPWILLAIYLIVIDKNYRWWMILSLTLSVLILSHNLSALIFVPIAALFAVVLVLMEKRGQWALVKGFGLGAAMSAFYVIPSLLEKSFTKVDEYIVGDYFDFRIHFLGLRQFVEENWGYGGSAYGPHDTISYFLGYGQLAAVGLAAAVAVIWLISRFGVLKTNIFKPVSQKHFYISAFFLAAFLLSAFMTHGHSLPLWELVDPLKYLQFPWRFLSVATLFLPLFAGQVISALKSDRLRKLIFIALTGLILIINWQYFAPSKYLEDNSDLYYTDAERIRAEMSTVLPDYMSLWLDEELPVASSPVLSSTEGVDVISHNSIETKVQTSFSESGEIYFSRAYYPGWEIYLDDTPAEKLINQSGLIGASVPGGEHLVRAKFERTPVRLTADAVSFAALVLFALLVTLEYRRKKS